MKKKILVFKICILVLIGSNQYAYSQCPSGQSQIIVDVITNDYPWSMENTWDIKDDQNNIIVSGTSGRDTFCYDSNKLLTFNIYDPSLDGLGPGSYHIYKDPWVPFGPVKTVVFNYPVGQKGDMLANVCKELRDHCNGIKLLSPAQINAHSTTITENRSYLGDNLSVITEAFNLIDCYDSKYGALFVDGKTIPNTPGALDGLEFKRAVFTLMQNLFNVLYTTPKTKEFSAFLNGKK